jgi:hypothetical protein
MERAGSRRRTFEGVRVRHVSPGVSRAAIWLALVCVCTPFLPEMLAGRSRLPDGSALLAATRDAAPGWFAIAAVCAAAAWLAARGLTEPVTVRLDSRCLYVATRRLERRTPRWMIEDVVVARPERREVQLELSSGRTIHLVHADAERARRFVEALGAGPGGRAAPRRDGDGRS